MVTAIQGADSVTTSVTVTYVIDVSLMEDRGLEPLTSCMPCLKCKAAFCPKFLTICGFRAND